MSLIRLGFSVVVATTLSVELATFNVELRSIVVVGPDIASTAPDGEMLSARLPGEAALSQNAYGKLPMI